MLKSRKTLRLTDYDYSADGAYFFTIVTQKRLCLLGEIVDGCLTPNYAGDMIARWWRQLEEKFPPWQNDVFVVMPNHLHGIIITNNPGLGTTTEEGAHTGAPLPRVIQWFKTMTTNEYIHGVKSNNWKPFARSLWQRSYFEHVIRDDNSLNRIRDYIQNNPDSWHLDKENPRATEKDGFDEWLAEFKDRPVPSSDRAASVHSPDPRRVLGGSGEDLAADILQRQGYQIIERNYRTPLGEIDLVARHQGALVFVEVKTRRSQRFGSPQEAVHPAKQERLRHLAEYYLQQQELGDVMVRFDVVGILWQGGKPRVEVITGAF